MTVALVFADGWVVPETPDVAPRLPVLKIVRGSHPAEEGSEENGRRAITAGTDATYRVTASDAGTALDELPSPGAVPELPSNDARSMYEVPDLDREPIVEFTPALTPWRLSETERQRGRQRIAEARARLHRAR